MLDEFRVELCVVSNFDRTRRAEQVSQRSKCITSFQIRINKTIQVDDEDAVGRGKLNQTQARQVRIEIRRLCIETDCLPA